MNSDEAMHRIDALLSHVWMVRTFLKHSEEAEEDDELKAVVRELYDYSLALGPTWNEKDAAGYLKQAQKKLAKLRAAVNEFARLQPEISTHTNFQMALTSLRTATTEIGTILDGLA
ncbi:MAG: amidohydrolase [Planctomycetia bacterium]|nr:amidohydrolase [Planctomycetia bacterium]